MSQNKILTNQLTINRCRDLILNKFRKIDLYTCLKKINHTISGDRTKLQIILYMIFDQHKDDEELIKIILDRGDAMDYYFKTGLEIDDTRIIPTLGIDYPSDYTQHENIINMRRLYFYDNIIKIGGWNYLTIRSIDHDKSLNFNLPTDLCKKIFLEIGSEVPPQTTFLLRCTRINDDNKVIDVLKDDYPVGMKLLINDLDFTTLLPREIFYTTTDKKERLSFPTILNKGILECQEHCKHSEYININVKLTRENNKNNTYAFGIFSSTQKSVKNLCNEILSRDEKTSIDDFKKDLSECMPKSGEIELDCTKISLLSSTTFKRIRIPFRGRNCNHIIPDDLEDYLTSNMNNEKWLCKICKNPCTPDDIIVDEFFEKILHKHPKDDEIFLYNGARLKYKVVDGKEMYVDDLLEKEEKEMDDIEVIVIDSDDEVTTMTRKITDLKEPTFINSLKSRKRRSDRLIGKNVNYSTRSIQHVKFFL